MSEAVEGPVWCKRAQVSSQWHAFECGPVQFTLIQEKKSRLEEISRHLHCGDLSPMATWQCLNQCLASPRAEPVTAAAAPAAATAAPGQGSVSGQVPVSVPGDCLQMPVTVQGVKRRDFLHMTSSCRGRILRRKAPHRGILVTARATDRLTRGSQACAVRKPTSSSTPGVGPGEEPGGNSAVHPRRTQAGGTHTPKPRPWNHRLDGPDNGVQSLNHLCAPQPGPGGPLLPLGEPSIRPELSLSEHHGVGPGNAGRPVIRQRLGREWKQPGLGLGLGGGLGEQQQQRQGQREGGMRVRAHSAFPGVPWVQVTVEQRTTCPLSSVPHSTSCFLIPQTLSSPLTSAGPRVTSMGPGATLAPALPADACRAGAAGGLHQAYCVGMDTWRPVLQLQLPPAAPELGRSSRLSPADAMGRPEASPGVLSALGQGAATACSPVLALSSRLLSPAAEAVVSRFQALSSQSSKEQSGRGTGGAGVLCEPDVCERPLKALCVPRRARPSLFSSGRALAPHHLRHHARQHPKLNAKHRRGDGPSRAQGSGAHPSEGLGRDQWGVERGQAQEGTLGIQHVGGFVVEIAPAASHRVLQLWRRLCKPFTSLLQGRQPQGPEMPTPAPAAGVHNPLAARLSSSSAASLSASHFPGPWRGPHAANAAAALPVARLLQRLGTALRGLSQSQGLVLAAKMREWALRGEMAVARLAGLEALRGVSRVGGGGKQVAPVFSAPVHGGWLSSHYGWRGKRFHHGIDIAVEENTVVTAAAPGTRVRQVAFVGWRGGYGKVVHLDHGNGFMTLYAHCNRLCVRAGQAVKGSDRIALSGNTGRSTGPHLHFEIQRHGGTLDPLWLLPRSYVHRLVPRR